MTAAVPEDDLANVRNKLERLNRLYSMLSHINRAIVRTEDPQDLYAATCRIAVEHGGFNYAWIGLVEPSGQQIVAAARAGLPVDMNQFHLSVDASRPEGRGPTSCAIRSGQPCVKNDAQADADMAPWREAMAQWSVRAVAAFPLRIEGRVVGAFSVTAEEAGFFRVAETHLLEEVADDMSFSLEVMRRDEKRAAAESKMQFLAYYDAQTGLPGRALFAERLAEACTATVGGVMAVLLVNLRRYHGILQVLGQAAGIDIARIVAGRLEALLPTATVGRLSESEFALMLERPDGLHLLEETAWSVHREIAAAIPMGEGEVFLDPFVGIALCPGDGAPAEAIKGAQVAAAWPSHDTSVYCRFFSRDMDHSSRLQLDVETALRRALERDEFVLHYQPQVDLASGRIVGAEALLRWRRPDRGPALVPPQDFIAVLEETGLIGAVGEWALHEACRRSRAWQAEGLAPFRMAVNLSARQFHDGDIKAKVRHALDAAKLDPEWLELELTEGIVLLNADAVIRTMHDLNAHGVSHALDDFGTGYSSLSYLQRLPVARIKIDRAFVANITSNPSDAAIARAIVGMAHSLGMKVVAEGVETEGQLGYVRGLGVEEIQGYHFSRPLPADEFAALLREGRRLAPYANGAAPERILLLLDDEPSVLSALNRALRRDGYRILATTSAREGFDLLASHPVGVVLCDQRMPEMTGTEFLRRTKELYPHTARIVLSGYTELNSVIDAVNSGAVYKFLTKPWDDEQLSQSLKDAFRFYEMGRENREMSLKLKDLAAG